MDDSISRQAAIKALNEQIELCNKALSSFDISMKDEYAVKVEKKSLEAYRETLEALPSAQPDLDEWCTDCKEYDSEKHCCPRFNKVIRQAMKDAQPERKKGRWNMIQGNIVVCSECGMGAPQVMTGCLMNRYLEPNMTNFCPNCGADMRGTEND